jgi:hypothetical protein
VVSTLGEGPLKFIIARAVLVKWVLKEYTKLNLKVFERKVLRRI